MIYRSMYSFFYSSINANYCKQHSTRKQRRLARTDFKMLRNDVNNPACLLLLLRSRDHTVSVPCTHARLEHTHRAKISPTTQAKKNCTKKTKQRAASLHDTHPFLGESNIYCHACTLAFVKKLITLPPHTRRIERWSSAKKP